MTAFEFIRSVFPKIRTEYEELLIEQTDIILHKLKFIDAEDRPHVHIKKSSIHFTAGQNSLLNSLIQIAGGIPIEDSLEADLLLLPQKDGDWVYDFDAISRDLSISTSKAYRDNQLYFIKEKALDASTETKLLASLETLAEIIQPQYFVYGREGEDWIKFNLNF